MPITVPKAQIREQMAPLPGARVNTSAGGAFDSGIGEANKAVQGIFAEEKQKADMTAFLDADLAASKIQAELETKYKEQYKGKDAAGAAQAFDAEYEKSLEDISINLSPTQRDMFQKSAKSRRSASYSIMEHHASAEIAKHKLQVTEDYILEARNGATSAAGMYMPGDEVGTTLADQNIDLSVKRQEAALLQHTIDNKLGMEWFRMRSMEAKTKTHVGVIDVMLAKGNDLMAKDYFKVYGDEIQGAEAIAHIEKSLHVGSVRGESQRQADALMAQFDNWKERDAGASKIEDPEVRAATKQLLDDGFSREKRFQAADRDANFIGGAADAEKAGSIRAIPPDVWAGYTVQERSAIEARLKHLKDGTEPSNDSALWTKFQFMNVADVAKLTEADMMRDYRPNLDDVHYDRALAQINAIKDAQSKGATYLSSMQTDKETVNNAWLQYVDKTNLADMSDKQYKRYQRFSDATSVAVQDYELEHKRKATDKEKQGIVRGVLARQVMVEEWGTDSKVPTVSVTPEEQGKIYTPMDQIPPQRKRGLVSWARSLNIIPQDATQAEAEAFLGSRLEKADAMGQIGMSDDAIARILTEGPTMHRRRK